MGLWIKLMIMLMLKLMIMILEFYLNFQMFILQFLLSKSQFTWKQVNPRLGRSTWLSGLNKIKVYMDGERNYNRSTLLNLPNPSLKIILSFYTTAVSFDLSMWFETKDLTSPGLACLNS